LGGEGKRYEEREGGGKEGEKAKASVPNIDFD